MSALAHEPRRPPPRTLADVRDPDGDTSYPVDVLAEARSALVLFAARWYGRQDAIHVADAGVRGTCVDVDAERLREMAAVYPSAWEFVRDDAYEFGAAAAGVETWDVVSLDPFSEQFERCSALVDLWCSLANRAVVLGAGMDTVTEAPRGWRVAERRRRSSWGGGVYWVVLERA